MNIQLIKSETENYFRSEGKEDLFKEKVSKSRTDLQSDFDSWIKKNPSGTFQDFKNHAIDEVKNGMQFLNEILNIGIFLTALEQIAPE